MYDTRESDAMSRHLGTALRLLVDATPDRELRTAVARVLDGSVSLRDAVRTEAFARAFDRSDAIGYWESLGADEWERLAEQGRRLADDQPQ